MTSELVLPPRPPEQPCLLRAYLAERKPPINLAFAWKMFRELLGQSRLALPRIRVADFVGQIADEWPVAEPAEPPASGVGWINAALRAHYAWSDKLADHYADAHRSAFICSSLLAATAVFLALLPMAAHWHHGSRRAIATAVVEAAILAFLVCLPLVARARRWHQRWLEYRVLAELVRELRILIPLGGARPAPRTPAHLANYGDPTQSWMYWQMRAIARAVGLPNAKVGAPYVADELAHLANYLGAPPEGRGPSRGQIGFHHANCERMERIHRRLHRWALLLFAVTIVGVALNLLVPLATADEPDWMRRWLIMVSAFFPALGAALASINNQGEFARLQRRSRAMTQGLAAVRRRLDALADPTGHADPRPHHLTGRPDGRHDGRRKHRLAHRGAGPAARGGVRVRKARLPAIVSPGGRFPGSEAALRALAAMS